jgi:hypothetical protein
MASFAAAVAGSGGNSMLLKASTDNPRYFAKPDGTPVFLVGPHHWSNAIDQGSAEPPPVFGFPGHLDFLVARGANWIRLWTGYMDHVYEEPDDGSGVDWFYAQLPWQRTGPGTADDGGPKADLTLFNQAYFDRVRARCLAARARGIWVSVMLFSGYQQQFALRSGRDAFPFVSGNNINGVAISEADFLTLNNSGVTTIQEAYVTKLVDSVRDLDNVMFEISNEAGSGSDAWQRHFIDFVHTYESSKPLQHPVGYTFAFSGGSDSDLLASNADWISPSASTFVSDGTKVVIIDTDHAYSWPQMLTDGASARAAWPFQVLCQGCSPAFMDPYLWVWSNGGRNAPGGTISDGYGTSVDMKWEGIRFALGDARSYAQRVNLKLCVPNAALSSTGFCLANPGSQYLALQNSSGAFTMTMVAGTYTFEWYDVVGRVVNGTGSVTVGSGSHTFTPPFSGPALLALGI